MYFFYIYVTNMSVFFVIVLSAKLFVLSSLYIKVIIKIKIISVAFAKTKTKYK